MNIEEINLSDYIELPNNPRKDLQPDDSEYQKLERSYDKYGPLEPIVVNKRTHHIVGGNQRAKVMRRKGISYTKAVIVDFDPDTELAACIALNKVHGKWDEKKLSDLFSHLVTVPDFDVTITGFDPPEISELLDQKNGEDQDDNFDFDAAVDAIAEPVTQKGDLIELGPHRILCGDSASPEDVKRLFGGEKASLIHMDPPYGCSYLAQNRPDLEARPKKSKRWEKLYKDDLNEEEYEVWLDSVLEGLISHLACGASAYIWNGHAKFYFMHQALKKRNFHLSTIITWAKPRFAISYGDYNQQTEFCLYGWLKNGPHKWYGPTNESNLWEIDRDKAAELIHPTQKSVKIPARAIRNSSKRGDIVADLFLGSGSSLIAAQSLDRRCFGIEIMPKYVDGIVRRYIAYVGKNNVSSEIRARYLKEESK